MSGMETGTRALSGWDPRRLLASARFYRLVQRALAPRRSFESFVADHLRPRPGDRVLDIGCGPADDLEYMPDVAYVGFDLSERYIESARKRWGNRGQFFCASVNQTMLQGQVFDIVIANGVLHHLTDADARALVQLSRSVLVSGGRLVTKDPVYVAGQSPIARFLISRDRGSSVRTLEGYLSIAEPLLESVRVIVRHDLLRVPYSHVILECSSPLGNDQETTHGIHSKQGEPQT